MFLKGRRKLRGDKEIVIMLSEKKQQFANCRTCFSGFINLSSKMYKPHRPKSQMRKQYLRICISLNMIVRLTENS